MHKLLWLLLPAVIATVVGAGLAVGGNANTNNKTFEYAIGLWGDTPYSDLQTQTGVPNVIADMNSSDISFSVHDGDLKAGNAIAGSVTPTACQNTVEPSIYSQALGYFNSLVQPAIFTAATTGPTATGRATAASTRSSGSSTSAASSSPTTSRSDSTRCSSRCRRRRSARGRPA